MGAMGKVASPVLISCRQATSGCVSCSHSSSRGIRPFTPLTLNEAIFIGTTIAWARILPPQCRRPTDGEAMKTSLRFLILCLAAFCGLATAQTLRWSSQGDLQTLDPHSQNELLTNSIN